MATQIQPYKLSSYLCYSGPYIYFYNTLSDGINKIIVEIGNNIASKFPQFKVFEINWNDQIIYSPSTKIEDKNKMFLYYQKIKKEFIIHKIEDINEAFILCIKYYNEKITEMANSIGYMAEQKNVKQNNPLKTISNSNVCKTKRNKSTYRRNSILNKRIILKNDDIISSIHLTNNEVLSLNKQDNTYKTINGNKTKILPRSPNIQNKNISDKIQHFIKETLPIYLSQDCPKNTNISKKNINNSIISTMKNICTTTKTEINKDNCKNNIIKFENSFINSNPSGKNNNFDILLTKNFLKNNIRTKRKYGNNNINANKNSNLFNKSNNKRILPKIDTILPIKSTEFIKIDKSKNKNVSQIKENNLFKTKNDWFENVKITDLPPEILE